MEGGFHTEPGEDHAVPNFLPIGNGKHMLLFFSHKRAGQYYIGHYDRKAHQFSPERHGRMNYGPISIVSLHAPSATIDDHGRFVAVFNVKEGKKTGHWTDVITIPEHLSLNDDGSLRIEPVPEVDSLGCDSRKIDALDIPANSEIALPEIRGKALTVETIIEPGNVRETGMYVLTSPDGREKTRISYYSKKNSRSPKSSLQIDVSESSLRNDVLARTPENGPIDLGEGEPLHLRVFIDRSIVEIYANGKQCLTIRVYPERDDSRGVSLFSRGDTARLMSLEARQMRSIWPELKKYEGA